MENNSNLKEDLKDFINERLNQNYKNLVSNKEYKKKEEECRDLVDKLNKSFNIDLFELYRDKNNNIQYIELQQAYLAGFKDSNIIFNSKVIFE